MASDPAAAAARHDPAAWARTLAYRNRAELPFDPAIVPSGRAFLFDATVYIDALKGELTTTILAAIASRPILHAAPVLAELSLAIGLLDPTDARTSATLEPIRDTLARISPLRVITPAADLWIEAAVMSGILSRIQGIPRADRRKLLNDALLFLAADDAGAVLLTRNLRDFDLLLQIKPSASVLFYDRI